jgi:hypothetical protein
MSTIDPTVRVRVDKDGTRELSFVDDPIPRAIYNRFANTCVETMNFLPIDANDLRQLMVRARLMKRDDNWNNSALDIFQAQSIRRNVTHQYLISNAYIVKSHLPDIVREYDANVSAIDIAHKWKHSPYFVFRHIIYIKYGNSGKADLARISRGEIKASDAFNARDAHEYDTVEPFDYESAAVCDNIGIMANAREKQFIALLRECGIDLMTQADLLARAAAEHTHPITPDALFTTKVKINGIMSAWVDFKAYFGAPLPYLMRSTIEQEAKYRTAFGPGFIAYEHGYVANLPYPAISVRGLRNKIEENVTSSVL